MTRSGALLVVISFFAIPLCPAQGASQTPSPQADEALHKGTEAIQAGKFADAEKWFLSAVNANPENPAAHKELGVSELRLGKPKEAAPELREAIAENPQMGGANLFLGIAYTQMNLLDESIAALNGEIELNPKNAQAQMWPGVVELPAGHPEKPTAPLDRAAELEPNNLNILDYRGKAHNEVALQSYARMASIDPNSWQMHKVRAEILGREKRYEQAVAEYLEAIKIAPDNADFYEELGDICRQSASLELAQHAYSKELELSPNNPIAIYNFGQIGIENGDAEKGLELLRTVIASYENVPATYFYLGLGEFEVDKATEAAVALEKARDMHPDADLEPRIEYELGRVYRKLGRNADAEQAVHAYTRLKAQIAKQNSAAQQDVAPAAAAESAVAPAQQTKN
jgi:tetratricopeptide (TPR) repeat protein